MANDQAEEVLMDKEMFLTGKTLGNSTGEECKREGAFLSALAKLGKTYNLDSVTVEIGDRVLRVSGPWSES
jgi:hypothetical protein